MGHHVIAITGRLSLRPPQRDSLELLARLVERIPLKKERDLAAVLEAVKAEVPGFTDFERDFPSLCFALATGVGKTRLMGAFISFLHLAKGIRHFFVLAPNLTIYSKLIADFTPNSPKYVFQGIAEFSANPPEIITGDNYESGRATRQEDLFGPIQINIFNISKINAEVRGGAVPKIKSFKEYIGASYFDYLSGLDDLVLLMDESHRYRAKAGMRAINELKPVLGLELTATPKVQSGQSAQEFKNVVYRYGLADALKDGFVKEPAVVTRENFDPTPYKERPEELDRIKLEDGVGLHEITEVELEVFARQNNKPVVKPFLLVVARTTEHADQVEKIIKADTFFGGRYRDKVITVHSNQSGEVEDETLRRLLDVEKREEHTEIVIHVNKLGEGWDVTNLYTIVPLRAFAAEILTGQTLGRGLRLPYGQRTGVATVDRLSVVAHDRFQEIVDAANRPDSIIRTSFKISAGGQAEHKKIVQIQPVFLQKLGVTPMQEALPIGDTQQVPPLFTTAAEQAVAQATIEVIQRSFARKPVSYLTSDPAMQAAVLKEVAETVTPKQGELADLIDKDDIDYDRHAELLNKLAGRVVAKLRSYLPDDAAVANVIQYNQLNYAELIYQQMQAHYFESVVEWKAHISPGFNEQRAALVSIAASEKVRDFRAPVDEKQDIRAMHFGGFKKCLYSTQKFDSDSERRMSVVLEQDDSVLKWFKPVNDRDIRIHLKDGSTYRPDFIVEAKKAKFLCEPKMRKEIEADEVKAKSQAAVTWCKHATDHENSSGGKPWFYILIPHDAITGNMTLEGLASRFAVSP